MKIKYSMIGLLCGAALVTFTGCSLIGANPSAPTSVEKTIFTVKTNYVDVVVLKTNLVTTYEIVTKTNEVGIPSSVTNVVTVTNVQPVIVPTPTFTLTPSDTSKAVVQTGGGILSTFYPGVGGMVASGILALLAVWGRMRSTKLGNTAAAVAQEVEALREFIKSLPQGAQYDSAITAFLQAHQVEAGVTKEILQILANDVSNQEAKGAAQELLGTISAATKSQ